MWTRLHSIGRIRYSLPHRRREKNIAWGQPALTNRLKKVLEYSGVQEELDRTNRSICLYSQRHFYVTLRLRNGLNIHLLSKQIGSSVNFIEQNYSHIQIESNTEKITEGMAKIKTLEEQDWWHKNSISSSLISFPTGGIIKWSTTCLMLWGVHRQEQDQQARDTGSLMMMVIWWIFWHPKRVGISCRHSKHQLVWWEQ